MTGAIVLADDSGLEIDYLTVNPGICAHMWVRRLRITSKMPI